MPLSTRPAIPKRAIAAGAIFVAGLAGAWAYIAQRQEQVSWQPVDVKLDKPAAGVSIRWTSGPTGSTPLHPVPGTESTRFVGLLPPQPADGIAVSARSTRATHLEWIRIGFTSSPDSRRETSRWRGDRTNGELVFSMDPHGLNQPRFDLTRFLELWLVAGVGLGLFATLLTGSFARNRTIRALPHTLLPAEPTALVWGACAIVAGIHALHAFVVQPKVGQDSAWYLATATEFLSGGQWRMGPGLYALDFLPGVPMAYARVIALLGHRVEWLTHMQHLVFSLSVLTLGHTLVRVVSSRIAAGAVLAIGLHPGFLMSASAVLPESLFTSTSTLLVTCMILLAHDPGRGLAWVGAAASAGASALMVPGGWLASPVLLGWLAFAYLRGAVTLRQALGRAGVLVLLGVSPFTAWNLGNRLILNVDSPTAQDAFTRFRGILMWGIFDPRTPSGAALAPPLALMQLDEPFSASQRLRRAVFEEQSHADPRRSSGLTEQVFATATLESSTGAWRGLLAARLRSFEQAIRPGSRHLPNETLRDCCLDVSRPEASDSETPASTTGVVQIARTAFGLWEHQSSLVHLIYVLAGAITVAFVSLSGLSVTSLLPAVLASSHLAYIALVVLVPEAGLIQALDGLFIAQVALALPALVRCQSGSGLRGRAGTWAVRWLPSFAILGLAIRRLEQMGPFPTGVDMGNFLALGRMGLGDAILGAGYPGLHYAPLVPSIAGVAFGFGSEVGAEVARLVPIMALASVATALYWVSRGELGRATASGVALAGAGTFFMAEIAAFGGSPTLFGAAAHVIALFSATRYLLEGDRLDLWLLTAAAATAALSHHFTFIAVLGSVAIAALFWGWSRPGRELRERLRGVAIALTPGLACFLVPVASLVSGGYSPPFNPNQLNHWRSLSYVFRDAPWLWALAFAATAAQLRKIRQSPLHMTGGAMAVAGTLAFVSTGEPRMLYMLQVCGVVAAGFAVASAVRRFGPWIVGCAALALAFGVVSADREAGYAFPYYAYFNSDYPRLGTWLDGQSSRGYVLVKRDANPEKGAPLGSWLLGLTKAPVVVDSSQRLLAFPRQRDLARAAEAVFSAGPNWESVRTRAIRMGAGLVVARKVDLVDWQGWASHSSSPLAYEDDTFVAFRTRS